jgi:iron complex outermembrane receptor protein
MQVNGFYQKEDYYWHRDFADPDSVYTVNSDREDYGKTISVSTDLGRFSTITFGADFKISSVDAIDDEDNSDSYWKNKGKQDQFAVYLQDEMRLLDDRLILIGGLRYDYRSFMMDHMNQMCLHMIS